MHLSAIAKTVGNIFSRKGFFFTRMTECPRYHEDNEYRTKRKLIFLISDIYFMNVKDETVLYFQQFKNGLPVSMWMKSRL